MKVVVDTNVLFSALLKNEDSFSEIIFLKEDVEIYASTILYVELFKHQPKIIAASKLNESDLFEKLHKLISRINFVNAELISIESLAKAHKLCKEIDMGDWLHVALSIEFGAKFWTTDKKLKEGLLAKGFDQFY